MRSSASRQRCARGPARSGRGAPPPCPGRSPRSTLLLPLTPSPWTLTAGASPGLAPWHARRREGPAHPKPGAPGFHVKRRAGARLHRRTARGRPPGRARPRGAPRRSTGGLAPTAQAHRATAPMEVRGRQPAGGTPRREEREGRTPRGGPLSRLRPRSPPSPRPRIRPALTPHSASGPTSPTDGPGPDAPPRSAPPARHGGPTRRRRRPGKGAHPSRQSFGPAPARDSEPGAPRHPPRAPRRTGGLPAADRRRGAHSGTRQTPDPCRGTPPSRRRGRQDPTAASPATCSLSLDHPPPRRAIPVHTPASLHPRSGLLPSSPTRLTLRGSSGRRAATALDSSRMVCNNTSWRPQGHHPPPSTRGRLAVPRETGPPRSLGSEPRGSAMDAMRTDQPGGRTGSASSPGTAAAQRASARSGTRSGLPAEQPSALLLRRGS